MMLSARKRSEGSATGGVTRNGFRLAVGLAVVLALIPPTTRFSSAAVPDYPSTMSLTKADIAAGWPADIPALDLPLCAVGEQAEIPVAAEHLRYGGVAYVYYEDQQVRKYVVPSVTFSPLTASAEELEEDLWAAKPADKDSTLSSWMSEAAKYRGTLLPSVCSRPERRGAFEQSSTGVAPAASIGHSASSNWAGYLNLGSPQRVVAHFQLGTLGNGNIAIWVGLGGTSGGLAQAGYDKGSGKAFWETICSGCDGRMMYGSPVVNGDVAVSVAYNPSSAIVLYSETNNQGYVIASAAASMPQAPGGTAEYIAEKYSGQNYAAFTTMHWSGARTYSTWNASSGGTYAGDQGYQGIELVDDGSFHNPPCITSTAILGYGELMANDHFQSIWCESS